MNFNCGKDGKMFQHNVSDWIQNNTVDTDLGSRTFSKLRRKERRVVSFRLWANAGILLT
jgi:hypothetical protein